MLSPASPVRSVFGPMGLLATIVVSLVLLGGTACALRQAEPATAFRLKDSNGKQFVLAESLKQHDALVLVFYRGYL